MANLKRVYPHPFETARDKGELEIYHKNTQLNRECAGAIDKAVSESNYEMYHYDLKSAVQKVCDEFGPKRVAFVLASVVQQHEYDGRYSLENKAWAQTIPATPEQYYVCNTHPTILDDMVKRVRTLTTRQKAPPLYRHTAEYARQNDQLDQYRENRKLNSACAKAIDSAARENFDGMHLKPDAAKAVIAEYGAERVALVLANTVQYKDYDGRFSQSNKEWAAGFTMPEADTNIRSSFVADHHPTIMDGFINLARKEMEPRKPSILGQLQDGKKAAAQDKEQPKTAPKRDSGMEV